MLRAPWSNRSASKCNWHTTRNARPWQHATKTKAETHVGCDGEHGNSPPAQRFSNLNIHTAWLCNAFPTLGAVMSGIAFDLTGSAYGRRAHLWHLAEGHEFDKLT